MRIQKTKWREELKLLWPFYLAHFISNVFAIGSLIWTVYLAQKGFTYTEIGIAMACLIAANFFFEVPTGAIADIFGRKTSVLTGFILSAGFILLVPFIKSFAVLVLLFTLYGMAITFISGAYDAWVIDYLRKNNKKELIQDFYVKIYSISEAAALLGGIFLTGILLVFQSDKIYFFAQHAFLGSDLVWFIEAAGIIFAILLLLLFTKEDFKRKKKKIHLQLLEVFKYSKKSISYVKKNPVLSNIFISIFLVGLFIGIWGFIYQPLLIEFGLKMKDMGWIRSVAGITGIAIPFAAKMVVSRYKNHLKILRWTFVLDFIIIASIIFLAGPIAGVIYTILLWNLDLFSNPILQPYIQENIPTKIRATVTSLQSMVMALGGIISSLIAGPLMDTIGAKKTMFASAFIILPIIWIYFRLKKEKHK